MEFYRLAHASYSDLSGQGGMYGSGRWHNQGAPILYTASSRALAALERFIHEDAARLPKLKMMTLWVPDNISISRYADQELPKGWDRIPDSEVSRNFGSNWLHQGKTAALQVPSAIIADGYNLLINPMHPEALGLKVIHTADFYYDPRLQRMIR